MSCFQVAVLASGSKGNSTLFKSGSQLGLIDMGISCRRVENAMKELGVAPQQLCGVFITHEHIDHVRGLATFVKKYQVPIYASKGTWQSIDRVLPGLDLSSFDYRVLEPSLSFGSLQVKPFPISHDAKEPVGYSFQEAGHKFVYVTDTGFINEPIKEAVKNAEVLVLEANHDLELLKNGSYPQMLKKRILGTRGHLANTAAAWLLAGMEESPQEVFLAHLSHENNTPRLALETVTDILGQQSRLEGVRLYVTSQETITKNTEWEDFHEKDIFE